jgi:hypothetical protein
MHNIIDVKPVGQYKISVTFEDGVSGVIDLSDLIGKGVFAAIKDPREFKRVSIDPQTHTVCWPNGIDLCPDSIYSDISSK